MAEVISKDDTVNEIIDNPVQFLSKIMEEYKTPRLKNKPNLTGGLVGYFSYDYLKYAEPTLRLDAEDTEGFKDVDLMLFDKVIAFDNFRQKMILIVNMKKNKKFQKEQLTEDGYTEIVDCYADSVENL